MGPFPAKKTDEIRIRCVSGHVVAVSNGLLGFLPLPGRNVFGVIVDAPKVEAGAMPGEVAGIGGRMGSFSLQKGETEEESVAGPCGMDVQISE